MQFDKKISAGSLALAFSLGALSVGPVAASERAASGSQGALGAQMACGSGHCSPGKCGNQVRGAAKACGAGHCSAGECGQGGGHGGQG